MNWLHAFFPKKTQALGEILPVCRKDTNAVEPIKSWVTIFFIAQLCPKQLSLRCVSTLGCSENISGSFPESWEEGESYIKQNMATDSDMQATC